MVNQHEKWSERETRSLCMYPCSHACWLVERCSSVSYFQKFRFTLLINEICFAGPRPLPAMNTWPHSILFPRCDPVTTENTKREFQEEFCTYRPFGLKIYHSCENSNTFHQAGSSKIYTKWLKIRKRKNV